MPRFTADKTGYYKNYYLAQRDIRRFQYYENKERKKKMDELYEDYGGEKEYYKMMYEKYKRVK